MKFSTTIAVASIAGLAAATPQGWTGRPQGPAKGGPAPPPGPPGPPGPKPPVNCLTDTTAKNLVNGFSSLLTGYKKSVADALLTDDFVDTSDSINWLAGIPMGSATFSSKAAFEAGQGTQPPIGFNLLAIDAVGCTSAAFRWEAVLGSGSPVKGINVLYAKNRNGTDQGWQINKMFSEFNSALWDTEIGGKCTPPGQ